MALTDLLEDFAIDNDTFDLKFSVSLKTSTLVNANFVLFVDGATPVEVPDAFQEIIIAEDYNSISRLLQLRWLEDVLEVSTDYRLEISNLQTVVGHTLSSVAVLFTTGADAGDLVNPVDVPLETPPEIVDYSIKTAVFDITSLSTSGATVPFGVEESDPIQGDFYLPPDYNNGRLVVTFTGEPDLGTINAETVKLQKRSVVRGPSRWTSLEVQVSSSGSTIYIDLPSVDHYPEAATPSTVTVYNTADYEYFEENTKYRLILSKNIASATED